MPRQSQQIPIMQGGRGGGGGGGSGSLAVAIGDFINNQSAAQSKMIAQFSKLQEAQAMEASQNAAQTTNAMNQIVAREDERIAREERMQEKQGDREYQERFHKWTAEFQQKAQKDFAVTQTRVASQMAAGRDLVQRLDGNRQEFGDRIRGMRQLLYDESNIEKWANTPGGLDRLEEMTKQLRAAEMFHEQDHQSTYTGQVAQMMAKVHEQILVGGEHADLTKLLTVKPNELLAAGLSGKDWSEDELEELYHSGGYPPGGLYGRDPDDPSLAKYKNFNPIEYMSNTWMMEDEQFFSMVHIGTFQDDYLAMRMESLRDIREELEKLQKFSTKDYDRLAATSVDGAYYGAFGFVDGIRSGEVNPNNLASSLVLKSGEFSAPDTRHALATKLLESVFTSIAGPGSDKILADLDELLKGEGDKGILDTPVELYKGFNMRNILRNIEDNLIGMTQVPKEGVPMSMALAKEIFDMPPGETKNELIQSLTMVPGDIERGYRLEGTKYNVITGTFGPEVLGQVHDGVNRIFRLAKQKAMELHDLVESQPTMMTYQMKQGATARYIDGIVASAMSDKPDADLTDEAVRQRAMRQASREDYRTGLLEVEGEIPEEFDIETETLKQAIKLSPLQAAGEIMAGVTSRPEFLAALYSGDYDLLPTEAVRPDAPAGEMRLALERYMGKSKRNRARVKAEMKRRREAHAAKSRVPGKGQAPGPQPGQGQGPGPSPQPQPQPQPGQVPGQPQGPVPGRVGLPRS